MYTVESRAREGDLPLRPNKSLYLCGILGTENSQLYPGGILGTEKSQLYILVSRWYPGYRTESSQLHILLSSWYPGYGELSVLSPCIQVVSWIRRTLSYKSLYPGGILGTENSVEARKQSCSGASVNMAGTIKRSRYCTDALC